MRNVRNLSRDSANEVQDCRIERNGVGPCFGFDGLPLPDGQASNEIGMLIPTATGWAVARQNDYVVKAPDGTLQAIRAELFEKLFEAVK